MIVEEQLVKFNLGNKEEPKEVLINAILPSVFQAQIKEVLMEYKDVFTWCYKKWSMVLNPWLQEEFQEKFVSIKLNLWLMFNLLNKKYIK